MNKTEIEAELISRQVFGKAAGRSAPHSTTLDSKQFLIIPGQHGPRWLVPRQARYGKRVLNSWRPYKFTSRIKWAGIILLYNLGLLDKHPLMKKKVFPFDVLLHAPGISGELVPVIYVGTPGPRRKAVVALVEPAKGTPQAIMKVALDIEARKNLLAEANILTKLREAGQINVPALLGIAEEGERTWQTVIEGRPTTRKLTRSHIDWLLKLPRTAKKTSFAMLGRQFDSTFNTKNAPSGAKEKELASRAVKRLIYCKDQVPLILNHGDFAPWNLKRQPTGSISAIDWESAELEGIPLSDICHFFLIQAHLFDEKDPIRHLIANPLVESYLLDMGLSGKYLPRLCILYILRIIREENYFCSASYREFLLNQLSEFLQL